MHLVEKVGTAHSNGTHQIGDLRLSMQQLNQVFSSAPGDFQIAFVGTLEIGIADHDQDNRRILKDLCYRRFGKVFEKIISLE